MPSIEEMSMEFSELSVNEDQSFVEMLRTDNREFINRHFDFIAVSEENELLIGASNLTGRYWVGDLYYYCKISDVVPLENYAAKLFFECGVCDGKFLNKSKKMIVGDDFGSLSIYNMIKDEADSTYVFYPQIQQNGHYNILMSLSVSHEESRVVSGGLDRSIIVWSAENLQSEHIYDSAHNDIINYVSFADYDEHIFGSSSFDGCALMWDIRDSVPAQVLASSSVGYNAIEWIPHSDAKHVILGQNDGTVSLIDTRHPGQILKAAKCFDTRIFRFSMHPEKKYVAVCADSCVVKVINCEDEQLSTIYLDERHEQFVRGLAWAKRDSSNYYLLSSGWDGRVLQHS